jgi:hypothetical protein
MAADTTPQGQVRLLINDVAPADSEDRVFTDDEIDTFLALEGGRVKRAAAQALDTIATNEALCSKVLRSQDVQTDGAKLAAELRLRAKALRDQDDDDDADDGTALEIVAFKPYGPYVPELTERRYGHQTW